MIPEHFAQTGLACWHPEKAPIRRVQVIGERSSGTNLLKRLIGRNTDLKHSDALGWKHGAALPMAIPADLAVILVVRRADDWARSMHAKPWHATPALQALEFSRFIRAPFETLADRPRYFEGILPEGALGEPLQLDRDPATGGVYPNLFRLRQGKMRAMLSYAGRECSFALVRLETLSAEPEATISALRDGLGVARPEGPFRPVVKRLGSRFKAAIPERPLTPPEMSPDDMEFLRAECDGALEAALGYDYP